MIQNKLSTLLLSAAISAALSLSAQAQVVGGTMKIPQPSAGQCQALVVVPAQFETRTEQVVVKEAAQTIEIIPAEYEWVEEEVMIKPAGEELQVIPATYKTVEEEIETEPSGVEKEVIPPQYSEVSEEIVSRPAYTVASSASRRGLSSAGGEVMRMSEIPAQYETIKKRVVSEKAQVVETPIHPVYITVKKQVLDMPAEVVTVPVEAEYETISVKKLVNEAREVVVDIPAEYSDVTVYEKVADAQMGWEPVLCTESVNQNTVEDLQRALSRAGYDVGKIDGEMGPSTTRALEAYQKDRNLSTGGVTLETLRSLGIQ